MINLAGNKECDKIIKQELKQAGMVIFPHEEPLPYEVPSSLTGILIKDNRVVFKCIRAWYYWVIKGDVPLEVAEILYSTPLGKKDVRVAGHCGCPPPKEWAFPKSKRSDSGKIQAPRFVDTYHIDSQEGLNFFVKTLKENHLAD